MYTVQVRLRYSMKAKSVVTLLSSCLALSVAFANEVNALRNDVDDGQPHHLRVISDVDSIITRELVTSTSAAIPNGKSTMAETSVTGVVTTLIINIFIFLLLLFIFERYRNFKQIYLKRLQPRFQDIGRVPPLPPTYPLGWLVEIMKWNENDVLNMVGLDAYMLLRYHVVCLKMAIFFSFWGLLVLVPIYSTVDAEGQWDKYTLSNVMAGEDKYKFRLWAAAIFGYVFAAYCCQLLYAEYSNFSLRRLQYLVQTDPDSNTGDPDTPPQKYFTVMVERIPGSLRSAEALHKFFDKLFPGQVYHVEVSLDIAELNDMNYQRKDIRWRLEKAIAFYEATNERPTVYIQTSAFSMFPDGSIGQPGEPDVFDLKALWDVFFAPEMNGYESLDAINYYTTRLNELNYKVSELQEKHLSRARNIDKKLQERLQKKYDTRVAAFVESAAGTLNVATASINKNYEESTRRSGSKESGPKILDSIENMFFGPTVQDYKSIARMEMAKLEVSISIEKQRRRTVSGESPGSIKVEPVNASGGAGADASGKTNKTSPPQSVPL